MGESVRVCVCERVCVFRSTTPSVGQKENAEKCSQCFVSGLRPAKTIILCTLNVCGWQSVGELDTPKLSHALANVRRARVRRFIVVRGCVFNRLIVQGGFWVCMANIPYFVSCV